MSSYLCYALHVSKIILCIFICGFQVFWCARLGCKLCKSSLADSHPHEHWWFRGVSSLWQGHK